MAVTLIGYRQPLARELDDLETHTLGGGVVNQAIAASLVHNQTGASTTRFRQRYSYVNGPSAAAGQQRTVYGYTPSAGALTVTPNYTIVPITGDEIECTSSFPCAPCLGSDTDYGSIINRALSLIYLKVTEPVTLVGGGKVSLTAAQAAWLTQPDQIERWLEPAPVASRSDIDASWRGLRLVPGVAPYIAIDSPFTGTLSFEGWRPADSLISGTYGTGLVNDTDTAYATVPDLILVGLMLAYRILANRNAGNPTGNWGNKYKDHLALVIDQNTARQQRGDRTLELAAAEASQQQARAA